MNYLAGERTKNFAGLFIIYLNCGSIRRYFSPKMPRSYCHDYCIG